MLRRLGTYYTGWVYATGVAYMLEAVQTLRGSVYATEAGYKLHGLCICCRGWV